MKLALPPLPQLFRGTTLPFDTEAVHVETYTPREIVSDYNRLVRNSTSMATAWHAAAIALDTEHVRIVQREADDGVYFIAAAARDFVHHPHAMTPLACALPGSPGHQGDGAYFVDLGSGIVSVVVKRPHSLASYVGERREAIQFAGAATEQWKHFWPTEGESWIGFRQYESRHARRLAQTAVAAGMVLTVLFLILTVAMSGAAELLANRRDVALDHIRLQQQQTATQLGAERGDAYVEYRKIAAPIIALGGRLRQFESAGDRITWQAEFPPWVSDLSSLGAGVKARVDDGTVVATK